MNKSYDHCSTRCYKLNDDMSTVTADHFYVSMSDDGAKSVEKARANSSGSCIEFLAVPRTANNPW
jgi:hypothetical protein